MKRVKKYLMCFSMSMQSVFTYRMDFFIKLFATFIPICVQFFLWTAIYRNSSLNEINGRSYLDMMFYLLFAFFVTYFIACDIAQQVAKDIKEGSLNQYLICPMNYLGYKIFSFLGNKIIALFVTIILSCISIFIFKFVFDYKLYIENIILFMFIIPISLIIQFMFFLNLSMLTFWISDTWGIFFGARYIVQILSGGLLPLELFGSDINKVLLFLPFQYIVYFPINILQGGIAAVSICRGVTTGVLWIILLFFTYQLLWAYGQKKYLAVGG